MSSCSQNIRKTSDNEYILNDEQLLGNGISGDVYRCLDSKTGKEYAIKIYKNVVKREISRNEIFEN